MLHRSAAVAVLVGLCACSSDSTDPTDAASAQHDGPATVTDSGGPGGALPDTQAGSDMVFTSSEGQRCSGPDESGARYECTGQLVCIATYSMPLPPTMGGPASAPSYLCRTPCTPNEACPVTSDICCPGSIHGPGQGKTHACVPPSRCVTVADAGSPG